MKDFEPTALVYVENTHEFWVGDKKGNLHILSADDFSTKQVIEKKHNH